MTNYIKKLLASITLVGAVLVTPALASQKITNDYGGSIVEYIQKYNDLKSVEGKLVLDGFCISACTLFLGIVNSHDTCATPNSFFGFHSASTGGLHSEEGTKLIGHLYPAYVNERLAKEGFNALEGQMHPDLVYITATELMPECVAN